MYTIYMKRYSRAFTLIELLVVISIISLLSSVVLASLNSAREKGRLAGARNFAGYTYRALGADAEIIANFESLPSVGQSVPDDAGNGYTIQNPNVGACQIGTNISPTGVGNSLHTKDGNPSSYVVINTPSVDPNATAAGKSFTFAAWVSPIDPSVDKAYIFFRGNTISGNQTGLYYDSTYTPCGAVKLSGGQQTICGTAKLKPGKWYHLALTVDSVSQTVNFYVDGQKTGNTISIVGNPTSINSTPYYVGGFNNINFAANAYIDQVILYTSSLTSAQLEKIYADGQIRHLTLNHY